MDGNTAKVCFPWDLIDFVANVEYLYSSISSGDDDCGNGKSNEGPAYPATLPPHNWYN
jgi:hypothetical protein